MNDIWFDIFIVYFECVGIVGSYLVLLVYIIVYDINFFGISSYLSIFIEYNVIYCIILCIEKFENF